MLKKVIGAFKAAKAMNGRQLTSVTRNMMQKAASNFKTNAKIEYMLRREKTVSRNLQHKYMPGSNPSILRNRGIQMGAAVVGAAGMTSIAVMNGAMTAAGNNMMTRYMNDNRYSSKLLQHRVGGAAGNSSLNIGNHVGLSLALSKSRHG